jgi:hypothetical protein
VADEAEAGVSPPLGLPTMHFKPNPRCISLRIEAQEPKGIETRVALVTSNHHYSIIKLENWASESSHVFLDHQGLPRLRVNKEPLNRGRLTRRQPSVPVKKCKTKMSSGSDAKIS